jgi:hypothetical protein
MNTAAQSSLPEACGFFVCAAAAACRQFSLSGLNDLSGGNQLPRTMRKS